MNIKFVTHDATPSSRRKRYNEACEGCRKRKKRCYHTCGQDDSDKPSSFKSRDEWADDYENNNDNLPTSTSHDRRTADQQSIAIEAGDRNANAPLAVAHEKSRSVATRFVGNLNPETVFLDRDTGNDEDGLTRHEVGVWLKEDNEDSRTPHSTDKAGTDTGSEHAGASTIGDSKQERCEMRRSDENALLEIYFSRINTVLPLLAEGAFREDLRRSKIPKPLLLSICLAAAKDDLAKLHLNLNNAPKSTREFSKSMYNSILEYLKCSRYDKLNLIRILALISLHSEGPDGAEDASLHLSQAIHHAHSIGIHLKRRGSAHGKLFWCLWGMDKINASINGRPVMINDRDIGADDFVAKSIGDKPFVVWLRIARLLDQVIDIYRPGAPDTGWEQEFPGFEDILGEFDAWSLETSHLLTLHLFYFTVAMVSSKSRIGISTAETASCVRRDLSSIQVSSLICESKTNLLPFPLVPYGISIAMSVAYTKMRRSKLPHLKAQAQAEFENCYGSLELLRHTWWSADIMAALARTVLQGATKRDEPAPSRRPSAEHLGVPAHELLNVMDQNVGTAHWPIDSHLQMSIPTSLQPANENLESPFNAIDHAYGQFDNIDQIFGTYLDPNFPLDYEDIFKLDNMTQFSRNENASAGL